jgi:hypothetical protein
MSGEMVILGVKEDAFDSGRKPRLSQKFGQVINKMSTLLLGNAF